MQKAINRLHRQILAGVNQGHGGNTAPIVSGLVKEMRRHPGILASVRMALSIVDNTDNQNSHE